MITNFYLRSSIAVATLGALVCGEVQGETHAHAQYMVPSTTNNLLASGGPVDNVSASFVTFGYTPSPVVLEDLLPHDYLVIEVSTLTPPTLKLPHSLPATGANPFFQRRQRAPRLEIQTPKTPPSWCGNRRQMR